MFTIIGLMFSGILVGWLTRKVNLPAIHPLITGLIWILLFLLGTEVGSNEKIINGLHTLGLEAIILTLAGTLGSVIFAWFLWKMIYPKRNAAQADQKGGQE